MKTLLHCVAMVILLAALNSRFSTSSAQGTAFTYQGQLIGSGGPVTGSYDLQFTLYTNNVTGNIVGGPVTNSATGVTNGLFTTIIDFGPGVFTGTSNWLAVAVRTNGNGTLIPLTPRQQLTPTPYALYAPNAGAAVTAGGVSGTISAGQLTGTLSSSQLSGSYSGPVSLLNGGNSFGGNGGALTNLSLSGIGPAGTFTVLPFYFGQVITLPVPYGAITVKIADVNGDGLPDLIVTSPSALGYGYFEVFTNSGGGNFTMASTNADGNGAIYSVDVGDFNGDGKADIVVGDGNGVTIYKGFGNGTFTPVLTNALAAGLFYRYVSVADINGDGHPDIVVANGYQSPGSLITLVNFGAGGFTFTLAQNITINDTITSATTADINGDGQPDIIYSANGGVGVYTNRNGVFTLASTNRVVNGSAYVVIGDVNGDGKPDLISTPLSSGIVIFTNAGGGIFVSNTSLASYNTVSVVAATNSAGLVTYMGEADAGVNTLNVLANDGHGNFTAVGQTAVGAYDVYTAYNGYLLATADVNGDGKPDFVMASGNNSYAVQVVFGYPQVLSASNPVSLTNGENYISGYFNGNVSGNGGALTNLNASQITGGTLADTELSANVPLLNGIQTFTGTNVFNSGNNSFSGQFIGSATLDSFFGRANGLTQLNASQLTSGTIPLAVIPTPTVVTNNASGVTLSGTFSGNGAGLTNTLTTGNYIFAYDTTSQAVATANTFQDVTFNANSQVSGWTHTTSTAVFTCNQAGLYLVQYTGEAVATTGTSLVSLRVVLNGNEINGSQSSTTFSSSSAAAVVIAKSFITTAAAADVLKIQLTASTTSGELFANNGAGNTRPSVSVTIIRLQ